MQRLFGTDGVRGVANRELTGELAFRLGRAGVHVLRKEGKGCPLFLLARDTRISGEMLEAALTAGILSAGGNVMPAGVLPTPAVAHLTRRLGVAGGVVISASHNPVADNGIKFFGPDGLKLSDELEDGIEYYAFSGYDEIDSPVGGALGRIIRPPDLEEAYIEFLKGNSPPDLTGLKVVVDCANGAAYRVVPRFFTELGAQVIAIHAEPDGTNINENCGAVYPQDLQKAVCQSGAHVGLAFDGDADRVIAVDERGDIVDGDCIMVVIGCHWKEKGLLLPPLVVVTVMSNQGLVKAFQEAGIEVRRTKVGDRYVLEEMMESGAVLGGEQSGHIIFSRLATTGDGVITGVELLRVMVETGKPLSYLASSMTRFPQVLVNIPAGRNDDILSHPRLNEVIQQAEQRLMPLGRVYVRFSGTEPVLRIMVEGAEENLVKEVSRELADKVRDFLGSLESPSGY